jgi:hypothetical protein
LLLLVVVAVALTSAVAAVLVDCWVLLINHLRQQQATLQQLELVAVVELTQ